MTLMSIVFHSIGDEMVGTNYCKRSEPFRRFYASFSRIGRRNLYRSVGMRRKIIGMPKAAREPSTRHEPLIFQPLRTIRNTRIVAQIGWANPPHCGILHDR